MSDRALVTKLSPRSVDDTVARLSEAAAAKGLKVFAVVDHSGEARAAGLELRDTRVVIFGIRQRARRSCRLFHRPRSTCR